MSPHAGYDAEVHEVELALVRLALEEGCPLVPWNSSLRVTSMSSYNFWKATSSAMTDPVLWASTGATRTVAVWK